MNVENNQICGAEKTEPADDQFVELGEFELVCVGGGSGDVVVC